LKKESEETGTTEEEVQQLGGKGFGTTGEAWN
jgi:hypothetical protein